MYYHNKNLSENAKLLRKNMTPEERKLWYEFLRTYPVRFLRQKVINNYIVDFYCSQVSLVIELDGGQHYEDDAHIADVLRDNNLNKLGFMVLRFTNTDVRYNFEGVCNSIDNAVKERLSE